MNKKQLLLFLNAFSLSLPSYATYIDYQLPQPEWHKLLDLGESWVRSQYKKSQTPNEIIYEGSIPKLGAYQAAYRHWTPGACISSDADNSGVWINNPAKIRSLSGSFGTYSHHIQTSSYNEYTISDGAPFELESKNFKSAGVKRFADYYYSFRIDRDVGNSIVIDNIGRHNYNTSHIFSSGESWLNSTTFSNFQWFIGIKGDFSDFSYQEHNSWSDWSNYDYKVELKGENLYLSECGFSKIVAEPNTRPTIHGVNFDRNNHVGGGGFLNVKTLTFKPDATDAHTIEKNLIYTWVINGQIRYGKNPSYSYGTYVPVKTYTYKLTVSDGDLSTTYNGSTSF